MSDETKLTLTATLTYDAQNMHGGDKDPEAREWFMTEILGGGNLTLHDNGDLGDAVGQLTDVRVTARDEANDWPEFRKVLAAKLAEAFDEQRAPFDAALVRQVVEASKEFREELKRLGLTVEDDEANELRALVGRLVKEVGYRTLEWAGTVCSYCGADQPGSEHWEDCIVLAAERRLAGGESEK